MHHARVSRHQQARGRRGDGDDRVGARLAPRHYRHGFRVHGGWGVVDVEAPLTPLLTAESRAARVDRGELTHEGAVVPHVDEVGRGRNHVVGRDREEVWLDVDVPGG